MQRTYLSIAVALALGALSSELSAAHYTVSEDRVAIGSVTLNFTSEEGVVSEERLYRIPIASGEAVGGTTHVEESSATTEDESSRKTEETGAGTVETADTAIPVYSIAASDTLTFILPDDALITDSDIKAEVRRLALPEGSLYLIRNDSHVPLTFTSPESILLTVSDASLGSLFGYFESASSDGSTSTSLSLSSPLSITLENSAVSSLYGFYTATLGTWSISGVSLTSTLSAVTTIRGLESSADNSALTIQKDISVAVTGTGSDDSPNTAITGVLLSGKESTLTLSGNTSIQIHNQAVGTTTAIELANTDGSALITGDISLTVQNDEVLPAEKLYAINLTGSQTNLSYSGQIYINASNIDHLTNVCAICYDMRDTAASEFNVSGDILLELENVTADTGSIAGLYIYAQKSNTPVHVENTAGNENFTTVIKINNSALGLLNTVRGNAIFVNAGVVDHSNVLIEITDTELLTSSTSAQLGGRYFIAPSISVIGDTTLTISSHNEMDFPAVSGYMIYGLITNGNTMVEGSTSITIDKMILGASIYVHYMSTASTLSSSGDYTVHIRDSLFSSPTASRYYYAAALSGVKNNQTNSDGSVAPNLEGNYGITIEDSELTNGTYFLSALYATSSSNIYLKGNASLVLRNLGQSANLTSEETLKLQALTVSISNSTYRQEGDILLYLEDIPTLNNGVYNLAGLWIQSTPTAANLDGDVTVTYINTEKEAVAGNLGQNIYGVAVGRTSSAAVLNHTGNVYINLGGRAGNLGIQGAIFGSAIGTKGTYNQTNGLRILTFGAYTYSESGEDAVYVPFISSAEDPFVATIANIDEIRVLPGSTLYIGENQSTTTQLDKYVVLAANAKVENYTGIRSYGGTIALPEGTTLIVESGGSVSVDNLRNSGTVEILGGTLAAKTITAYAADTAEVLGTATSSTITSDTEVSESSASSTATVAKPIALGISSEKGSATGSIQITDSGTLDLTTQVGNADLGLVESDGGRILASPTESFTVESLTNGTNGTLVIVQNSEAASVQIEAVQGDGLKILTAAEFQELESASKGAGSGIINGADVSEEPSGSGRVDTTDQTGSSSTSAGNTGTASDTTDSGSKSEGATSSGTTDVGSKTGSTTSGTTEGSSTTDTSSSGSTDVSTKTEGTTTTGTTDASSKTDSTSSSTADVGSKTGSTTSGTTESSSTTDTPSSGSTDISTKTEGTTTTGATDTSTKADNTSSSGTTDISSKTDSTTSGMTDSGSITDTSSSGSTDTSSKTESTTAGTAETGSKTESTATDTTDTGTKTDGATFDTKEAAGSESGTNTSEASAPKEAEKSDTASSDASVKEESGVNTTKSEKTSETSSESANTESSTAVENSGSTGDTASGSAESASSGDSAGTIHITGGGTLDLTGQDGSVHIGNVESDGGGIVIGTSEEVRVDTITNGEQGTVIVVTGTESGQVHIGEVKGEGLTVLVPSEATDTLSGNTAEDAAVIKDIVTVDKTDAPVEIIAEEGRVLGETTLTVQPDGTLSLIEEANTVTEGLEDIASTNFLMFRTQINDLDKRMGDLRSMPKSAGAWVRYYGGQMRISKSTLRSRYNTLQLGADGRIAENFYLGATASFTDDRGNLANGTAKGKTYSFGLYGGWLAEDGQFADVIVKRHRVKTETSLQNTAGFGSEARYYNWGTSVSFEYGRRLQNEKTGWYIEPQTEIHYGRLDHVTYRTSRDVTVNQKAVESLVGRVGLAAGRVLSEEKGSFYGKVSVLHDWKAKGSGTLTYKTQTRTFTEDLGGTWAEFALGGTYNVTKKVSAYGEVQTTAGSPVRNPWQVSIGLRYSF